MATIRQTYLDVLGREPDAPGLANWTGAFGDDVSAAERAQFTAAAQPELAVSGYRPPSPAAVTNSYADLLAAQGLGYRDLGDGRYEMLDSAGTAVGVGYKSLDDSIHDLSVKAADPYIKQTEASAQVAGNWLTGEGAAPPVSGGQFYFDGPSTVANNASGGNNGGWENPQAPVGLEIETPAWQGGGAHITEEALGANNAWQTVEYDFENGTTKIVPKKFDTKEDLIKALTDSGYFKSEGKDFQGNDISEGDLQKWEILGQLLNPAIIPPSQVAAGLWRGIADPNPNTTSSPVSAADPASWRDFGGDQKPQAIQGLQALYGSTPVFENGRLTGYSIDMLPATEGDYGYRNGLTQQITDNNGGTRSRATISRAYGADAWKGFGSVLPDNHIFVSTDKANVIPGWVNVDTYDFFEEEDNGFGIGHILGIALAAFTGQPWIAGAVGAAASGGGPADILKGGLVSWAGGALGNMAIGAAGDALPAAGTFTGDFARAAIRGGVSGGLSATAGGQCFADILTAGITGAVTSGVADAAGTAVTGATDSSLLGGIVRDATGRIIRYGINEATGDGTDGDGTTPTPPGVTPPPVIAPPPTPITNTGLSFRQPGLIYAPVVRQDMNWGQR